MRSRCLRTCCVLAIAFVATACEENTVTPPTVDPRYLERLESSDDYALLQNEGTEIKYLARVDGREPLAPLLSTCVFQDTERFPYHIQFLHDFPVLADLDFDTYVSYVLRRSARIWWGGQLKVYAGARHPRTGRVGVIGYFVYQETGPDENFSATEIIEIDRRLKGCAPYAADLLVLVPGYPEQQTHLRSIATELEAAGVVVVDPRDLRDGVIAEGYSLGEGYGYLRVTPQGQSLREYGPRDVVVAESSPNDISIVAGLVTELRQNLASHVNLRLQEKGIPNASAPTIYDNTFVLGLENRLVHIVVEESSVDIQPATLEDAQAFWDSHRPVLPPLRSDLTVTSLQSFADIGAEDAVAYGAKAANLGEIYDVLPPENRNVGIAIPFSAYRDHIMTHGLQAQVDALLNDPLVRTDAAYKRQALDDLHDAIRDAPMDPVFFDALRGRLEEVLGASVVATTRLRFRSSTNAEDLDELTGAGLYSSRSGCLADDLDGDALGPSACLSAEEQTALEGQLATRQAELASHPERTWLVDIIAELQEDLTEEKPIALAVRKVWASLWNERAFDEREYYGLDHRQVFMGMAVHQSAVLEQREAVAFTGLRVDGGDPLYRLISQMGDIGVVQPVDPSAIAETLTFRRRSNGVADVQILIRSNQVGPTESIWTDAQVPTIGSMLFLLHDHFAANVYTSIPMLSLDVEIEHASDGRILFKQARPFVGARSGM